MITRVSRSKSKRAGPRASIILTAYKRWLYDKNRVDPTTERAIRGKVGAEVT